MDIFKSIDWNPSINDIIDDEFINGERLERESAMYKILRGNFTDPFADIHEDFLDLVSKADIDANEQEKERKKLVINEESPKEESEKNIVEEVKKHAKYYPGISRAKAKFPRWSSLTEKQHAACVRVLLQFSAPGKPDISKINREDLDTYTRLQTTISEEQTEFLKVAKDHWDSSEIQLIREDLINRKWKYKMKYVEQLPRYCTESGTIPFICNKDINVCFNAVALETGKIPRMIIPPLIRPTYLPFNSIKMERNYFNFPEAWVKKNLISEDVNCQRFVESNEIDLVISSSGINCLANNLDPSYKNSWALPVTVKTINDRRVIFIDKPLPPLAKSVLQKNAWVCKAILKSLILHPGHNTSVRLDQQEKRKKEETEIPSEEAMETDHPQMDNLSNDLSAKGVNFSYNIFTIGACGLPQNEMMKNKVERDYKILVRTKTDGVEKLSKNQIQCMMIAPKMEHQLGLGAEAVTLEEASRQWAALTFRPDTALLRVRIHSWNKEIIQYERRTAMSVNNEMKRLYNVKGEDCLQFMYNVAENMVKMAPGRYLIRHTARNGAFASIYKETEASGKNTIDLQALYCDDQFQTIPNPPWPLIDKVVPLPMHECFGRMPAMFHPDKKVYSKQGKNPPKGKGNPPKPAQEKSPKEKKKSKKKGGKTGEADTSEETTS
ncbi:uncharacterized protein LOC107042333 [Diachasma alloeum]|uniref:uncharacterized protein LOC107042333 n=1 Tax=Diachasma alloeum TaxID=454923 RepID=UPI000738301C|nr:uncharacterized protein LOC107042333 [Diachasma alloeum]